MIKQIKKRDGRVVAFEADKISRVILLAGEATGELGKKEANRLSGIVVSIIEKANGRHVPEVEQVQDIVEQVLMAAGHYETAKAFILYRERHAKERVAKQMMGVADDVGMSINALKVMARRYLLKDGQGRVIETPKQAFERVAEVVARVEKKNRRGWQEKFEEVMLRKEFIPAGCYFRGAGTKNGMLSNCFVLPVEDSIERIFEAVKWTAQIHAAGGGTGYNFSHLRPKGDKVDGGGLASGPVNFMRAFDAETSIVMQGGTHRGANMGILNADHPDILEFITCKTQEGEIANFNISVGATDAFMEAVVKDRPWNLINPRDGQLVTRMSAKKLFGQVVQLAWKTGDPGMIFLDNLNKDNPLLKSQGPIDSTNVCGEVPLYPFEPCNLGSINLAKFVREAKNGIDWERLERVARLATRFLDDGVDASKFPLKQITEAARTNRRIGVGVMGWAEMLYQLKVRYDSEEAVKLARKVMGFIQKACHDESGKLAREKGVFSNFKGSEFERRGKKMRNVAVTTIAPTGTISMVADCSSGIEPVFALSYVKNVVDEAGLTYTNAYFEQALMESLSNGKKGRVGEVLREVVESGSVQEVTGVPRWIKEVFRVAYDIAPEWHVKMQAAFQEFTDNAVSKTINFPVNATVEDIEKAYVLAWKLGCKGITVYRDQSKAVQILSTKSSSVNATEDRGPIIQSKLQLEPLSARAATAVVQETGMCPECGAKLIFSEGCATCSSCGYSHCAI